MKKLILLTTLGIFLITACTPSNTIVPSNTALVDTTKISSLIEQKCASCHSTKTKASDGVSYDSYDDMVKGVKGINKTVVVQRSMPRGSITMTEEEITLIKQWAEQVSK